MEQPFGVSVYRRFLCLPRFFQYVLFSILSVSLFDLLVLFPVLSCFFLLTIPTYSPLVHFWFKKFPFIYCFPRFHSDPLLFPASSFEAQDFFLELDIPWKISHILKKPQKTIWYHHHHHQLTRSPEGPGELVAESEPNRMADPDALADLVMAAAIATSLNTESYTRNDTTVLITFFIHLLGKVFDWTGLLEIYA